MAQRIKVQDGRVVYQHTDPIIDIDFYIDGNLHVRNDTDIAGGLTTIGNVNFGSDLTVTGNANVNTDLIVTGSATVQTNLNVNDTFYVTNDAYVYDSLFITNNGSVGGDLTVTNNLDVLDSVTVTNTVTATSFIGAVSGNATSATTLDGGTTGDLVYQSAPGTTAYLPAGTTSQVLISGAMGPSWTDSPVGLSSVGIGTTTPTATLEVNGTAKFGPTTINGPATITAPLTAPTATFSGGVSASSLTASGTVSGATATISGSITATSGSFTGSVTSPIFIGAFSGNASTASTLQTARTISSTGDATWSVSFDGSADVTNPIVLATVNSSPQVNAFNKFTVNSKGLVTATTPVTTADITALADGTYVNITGDTMTGSLILNAAPTVPLEAATKQYVDDIASGLNIHVACRAATLANLSATYNNGASGVGATLTGVGTLPAIDGVTLAVNDRILVKNQTTQTQNGIYVVTQTTANWILTRATDFDGSPTQEIQAGDATYIQEGGQQGTQWVQTTPGPIAVGTSNIIFTQFGGPGTYTGGTGINVSGTVISNTGVVSLAGTPNQVSVSAATGNVTVSLPSSVTIGGTMTAGLFSGSGASLTNIPNGALVNNSITLGSTNIALGGSTTTLAGLSSVTSASFVGALTGNSSTATTLETSRTISATGDATWSVNFNGSANVSSALTLATVNSSPQTDSFRKITVNGKGLVTATSAVTTSDITSLVDGTYVNVTGDTMSGSLTAPSFIGALSGNATTASTLQTTRSISTTGDATWSVNFNGGADVSGPITLATVNANIGTFNNVTVNGKGLVTSASNVAYLTGNQNITISGDASGSGTTSIGLTFATVNANVGTFSYPTLTVNGKGLVTAISSNTPVTSVASGTGISVSAATGGVTITNTGVTSLSGTANQVSVSGATGSVTVSLPSSVTIGGTMTAGTFNATSTKRVKKAIKNLNKTYISNFSKLRPREYDRTDYAAHEFGFIAEEMIKVYPEVVGVDNQGNATGIDYGKLSTILTAKIQEQDKTIKELQKQVNELISIVKGSK